MTKTMDMAAKGWRNSVEGEHTWIELPLLPWILAALRVFWEFFTQHRDARFQPPLRLACHPSIRGKTVIITGPTSGIGLITARELAAAGAHVVLACRRPKAGQALVEEWKREIGDVNAEVLELDLNSLASVRQFATEWEARKQPLHVLINNAGIVMARDVPRITENGFEEHFQVNYLAPLMLTLLLLPSLLRARGARVVDVSSCIHDVGSLDLHDVNYESGRRLFWSIAVYSQSKLAQLLTTNLLHRKLPQEAEVDVVAVHPGQVRTAMVESHWTRVLPKVVLFIFQKYFLDVFCLTPSQGACGPVFCATQPWIGEYAAKVRWAQQPGGPYFTWQCQPKQVPSQAENEAVGKALWKTTLKTFDLPEDYVELEVAKAGIRC